MNKISVVIPTYNRYSTLNKVIDTYLNEEFVKEVVVVDDHSTDETQHYLQDLKLKEKKLIYIRNSSNQGGPFSKNKGIAASNAKYIFIGEDDLVLSKNFLKTLFSHMIKNKADIVSGRRIWLQKGESFADGLERANNIRGEVVNLSLLTTNCEIDTKKDIELPLVDASMLFNVEVFQKVRYDHYYKRTAWREETDFQLSALSVGYRILYCPHVVAYHLYKEVNNGGNHSHNIMKYEFRVFVNNIYMVRKHWRLLKEEFGINHAFYFRFFVYRLSKIAIFELNKVKSFFQQFVSINTLG